MQSSSVRGIKNEISIGENLKHLASFPNLRRFIFERDICTALPPGRRWPQGPHDSGFVTADNAQQILGTLCSARFITMKKFIGSRGRRFQYRFSDGIDFLCRFNVRHRCWDRDIMDTLQGVCSINMSNETFYFDAGGLLSLAEGFQHVISAQNRSRSAESSDR